MNNLSMILSILVIVITLILKVSELYYRANTKDMEKKNSSKKTDLLRMDISYIKFEEVSKKSLSSNSPMRVEKDFLTFFRKSINHDSCRIENNILKMNCGGKNE